MRNGDCRAAGERRKAHPCPRCAYPSRGSWLRSIPQRPCRASRIEPPTWSMTFGCGRGRSPVDAVRCAVEVQREMAEIKCRCAARSPHRVPHGHQCRRHHQGRTRHLRRRGQCRSTARSPSRTRWDLRSICAGGDNNRWSAQRLRHNKLSYGAVTRRSQAAASAIARAARSTTPTQNRKPWFIPAQRDSTTGTPASRSRAA